MPLEAMKMTGTTETETATDPAGRAKNDLLWVVGDKCRKEVVRLGEYADFYLAGGDRKRANIGALTTQIASAAHSTTDKVRYRLNKLERAGKLLTSKTAGGITRWWPVGLAEELNA